MNAHDLARSFQDAFAELDPSRPFPADALYDPDVRFVDPFHTLEGRDALAAYFDRLNRNVRTCRFTFHTTVCAERDVMMTWTMHLVVRRGPQAPILLDGASHLVLGETGARLHRDYFDAGAMIYERVPVLGSVIRAVKRAM